MPSGLSQSHQEIAGQFQWELLQLICLGSGGQHVQRPLPRGMGRPIGLQCPCNSFTRQEVRGASDSTNQQIENNALVSSSGFTGGARRVVYLVVLRRARRRSLHPGVVVEAGGNVRVVVGVGHVGPEQERSTCGNVRDKGLDQGPSSLAPRRRTGGKKSPASWKLIDSPRGKNHCSRRGNK